MYNDLIINGGSFPNNIFRFFDNTNDDIRNKYDNIEAIKKFIEMGRKFVIIGRDISPDSY